MPRKRTTTPAIADAPLDDVPPAAVVNEQHAARYLDMSVGFLRAARRRSGVGPPYVRMGKAIRYRLADLDAWLVRHVER